MGKKELKHASKRAGGEKISPPVCFGGGDLNCSSCKEPMIVLDLDGVEIDYCAGCGSIWLDSGELELLVESASEKTALLDSFLPANKTGEKTIDCPICGKRMGKSHYLEVLLDKCPAGHGIWFDKGELHDIVAKSSLGKNTSVLNMLRDILHDKLEQQTNKEGS
jgi:Zn-finger nucleic acid-binding protein